MFYYSPTELTEDLGRGRGGWGRGGVGAGQGQGRGNVCQDAGQILNTCRSLTMLACIAAGCVMKSPV